MGWESFRFVQPKIDRRLPQSLLGRSGRLAQTTLQPSQAQKVGLARLPSKLSPRVLCS
jgi:hypothetical protein